jgi:hypothetical protein
MHHAASPQTCERDCVLPRQLHLGWQRSQRCRLVAGKVSHELVVPHAAQRAAASRWHRPELRGILLVGDLSEHHRQAAASEGVALPDFDAQFGYLSQP